MGIFDTVRSALDRVNEEPVARFASLFFSFSSLASNTKHPIHQKMLDFGLHHVLGVLQASDCTFAVFHASLALAVLQTNKELKTSISYQNPLADQFIRFNQGLEKCEKFREENNRRTAFGTVTGQISILLLLRLKKIIL